MPRTLPPIKRPPIETRFKGGGSEGGGFILTDPDGLLSRRASIQLKEELIRISSSRRRPLRFRVSIHKLQSKIVTQCIVSELHSTWRGRRVLGYSGPTAHRSVQWRILHKLKIVESDIFVAVQTLKRMLARKLRTRRITTTNRNDRYADVRRSIANRLGIKTEVRSIVEPEEKCVMYLKPGTATSDEIAKLLGQMDDLYKAIGGKGLNFKLVGVRGGEADA